MPIFRQLYNSFIQWWNSSDSTETPPPDRAQDQQTSTYREAPAPAPSPAAQPRASLFAEPDRAQPSPAAIDRTQAALLHALGAELTMEDIRTVVEIEGENSPARRLLTELRSNATRLAGQEIPEAELTDHLEYRTLSAQQFSDVIAHVRTFRSLEGFASYQALRREQAQLIRQEERMERYQPGASFPNEAVQAERVQLLERQQATQRGLRSLAGTLRQGFEDRAVQRLSSDFVDRDVITEQIRESLPRQMRTPRYNTYIDSIANRVVAELGDMPDSRLREYIRAEHGLIRIGGVPDTLLEPYTRILREGRSTAPASRGPTAAARRRARAEGPEVVRELRDSVVDARRIAERR